MHEVQALKPRLAALPPMQLALPRQATLLLRLDALVPSQEGMQAMQPLNTRLAALPQVFNVSSPQAGNTSFQVDSTSPQQGRNAGNASVQSQHFPQASRVSSSQGRHPLVLPGILPPRGENTLEDPKLKWVINLSRKPLMQAQRSLLAKGPNFVVTSSHPPNLEYITAIESVCSELGQQDAEELRANINRVLRSSHPQT